MSDRVQTWDGVPILALSEAQHDWLLSFAPHWHGCAVGPPIPFGAGEMARISVNYIMWPTREEAVEAIIRHVENACIEQGLVYDEREWSITHCVMVNGC